MFLGASVFRGFRHSGFKVVLRVSIGLRVFRVQGV